MVLVGCNKGYNCMLYSSKVGGEETYQIKRCLGHTFVQEPRSLHKSQLIVDMYIHKWSVDSILSWRVVAKDILTDVFFYRR